MYGITAKLGNGVIIIIGLGQKFRTHSMFFHLQEYLIISKTSPNDIHDQLSPKIQKFGRFNFFFRSYK